MSNKKVRRYEFDRIYQLIFQDNLYQHRESMTAYQLQRDMRSETTVIVRSIVGVVLLTASRRTVFKESSAQLQSGFLWTFGAPLQAQIRVVFNDPVTPRIGKSKMVVPLDGTVEKLSIPSPYPISGVLRVGNQVYSLLPGTSTGDMMESYALVLGPAQEFVNTHGVVEYEAYLYGTVMQDGLQIMRMKDQENTVFVHRIAVRL